MTGVTIRAAARQDISDIWRYTAQTWGVAQADTYILAIDDAIMRLARRPQSAPRCNWIRTGYRRLKAGAHYVFARVEGDRVVIIRVLHERMNLPEQLDDEDPDPSGQGD